MLRGNVGSFLMAVVEPGWMCHLKNGCRPAYDNITDYLNSGDDGDRVFLNANITNVKRPQGSSNNNGKITVSFEVGSEKHKIITDMLIVAFPPTLENFQKIGMDLFPEEMAVFEFVEVSNGYYGVSLQCQESITLLSNTNLEDPLGELNLAATPMPIYLCDYCNQSLCHSFAVSTDKVALSVMEDRIDHQSDLADALPTPVHCVRDEVVEHSGYFPHVKQAVLAANPNVYGQAKALNGLSNSSTCPHNTCFTGAYYSYADRTLGIEETNLLAQRVCPPLSRRRKFGGDQIDRASVPVRIDTKKIVLAV